MTCLSIVQKVCKRVGIATPNSAVSSSDPQVLQVVELCNEEGQELAARYTWTALQTEATYTTLATEIQGSLATIAPGLLNIVNNTIWNRSQQRPVYGPKTPQGWQQDQANFVAGPYSSFRIKAGNLLMYPVPTAGESCYFEYISRNWVNATAGGTDEEWTADTDTTVFDEQLIVLGTVWRWKAAKGFEYAEDFNKYERRVLDAIAQDGSKPMLRLDGPLNDMFPAVLVPAGSWNQP